MSDSDSNEESDWEEVKEEDYILPKLEEENQEDDGLTAKEYTQQLDIPTGGIEITIEKDGENQSEYLLLSKICLSVWNSFETMISELFSRKEKRFRFGRIHSSSSESS